MKQRMIFIDELRERIVSRMYGQLPGWISATRDQVEAAVRKWEAGGEVANPLEAGVFAGCDQIREEIMSDPTQPPAEED